MITIDKNTTEVRVCNHCGVLVFVSPLMIWEDSFFKYWRCPVCKKEVLVD